MDKWLVKNVPPIEAYEEEKVVFAAGNEVVALDNQLKRSKVSKIMRTHIMMVFSKTMTNTVFSRKDIVEWLGFSAASAGGRVLAKMKELKLVEPVTGSGNGKYRFRKELYGE